MNELVKNIGAIIIVFLIGFGGGYFASGYFTSEEIREAESNLRGAIKNSKELRKQLEQYRTEIKSLEEIAQRRRERVKEVEERLERAKARARARDEVIAGLEAKVGELTGEAADIAELAREGRRITKELLGEDEATDD